MSYLELHRVKHTGCNARALMLTDDKALTKSVLASHGIPTPRFQACADGKPPRSLAVPFPAIVKPQRGSGSAGISQRRS